MYQDFKPHFTGLTARFDPILIFYPIFSRPSLFTPFPQAFPAAALTQHSLPHAPQLHVGCLESFCLLAVQGLLLAVDHDGAAPLQNPLRGSFHHQQEAFVVRVVGLVDGELCHKQEMNWKSSNSPRLLLLFSVGFTFFSMKKS